jgi:hypothetical protein
MSIVTGTTKTRPTVAWWYWVQLGPNNVELTDRSEDLPAGNYELNWDFRGSPGDALHFTVTDKSGAVLADVTDQIPPGQSEGWGSKAMKVN